jgi:Hemerythrin HHE cation binding domain./Phasin protein.
MTIAQLIQAAPAKANELFAKLADTTVRAVKTRERLLADLREELDLQIELEEKHLFPALRRHTELKGLVADAIADNRQTRKLLGELERMPKDDDGFAPKVTELRRVFQQHIRDERKELLPAIRKVLSGEEAQAVADRMEAGRAEIADSRTREPEQAAPSPKTTPKAAPQAAPKTAETSSVREASAAIAETAGKMVPEAVIEDMPRLAEAGVRAGAEAMLRGAQQAADSAKPMTMPVTDGLETLAFLPGVAASATSEVGRVWTQWAETTWRAGVQGAQELARARDPRTIAEAQGRMANEAMRAWLDASARLLDIAMHTSRDMLKPMERQAERMKVGK